MDKNKPNKEYSNQIWKTERLFPLSSNSWWIDSLAKLIIFFVLSIFTVTCSRENINKTMKHTKKRFSFISYTLAEFFHSQVLIKPSEMPCENNLCFLNTVKKDPLAPRALWFKKSVQTAEEPDRYIAPLTWLASYGGKSPFVTVPNASLVQMRDSDRL